MSLETWKKEFYPVPADEVDEKDALEHSLRKWKGLRSEVLERHGVTRGMGVYIVESDHTFRIDNSSCALCKIHRKQGECSRCPLATVRGGVPCDEPMTSEVWSPYLLWLDGGDPEPMIALLEAAIQTRTIAAEKGARWKWERLPEQDHPTVPEWTLKGPDVLCRFWHDRPPSDDARLIAAAPDLLAVCKAFLEKWHRQGVAGFQLEKFDQIATQMEAAVGLAEPAGGKDA